jgi:hypothetical protein
MAFITYALITGFVKGRASTFTPEVSDLPLQEALFRAPFRTVPCSVFSDFFTNI